MSEQDKKQDLMKAPELSDEIRRLIRTPVGRRLFLKLGGASALKVALGGLAFGSLGGCSDGGGGGGDVRPRETRHLYFALDDAAGAEELAISVGESDYALESITEAHRKALTASGGVWSKADPANLSHIARDVDLPSDRSLLLHVTGQIGDDTVYVGETMHLPREASVFAWSAALELVDSATELLGETSWHEGLGVTSPEELSAEDLADLGATITPHSIAATLVYKHPEIVSMESDSSAVTMTLLLANPGVSDLGEQIAELQQQGIPYAKEVPILDENGDQLYLQNLDGTVKVAANNAVINSALDDRFGRAARLCVSDIKNSMALEGATWHFTPGTPPQPIPVASVSLPEDDDLKVSVDWTGYKHGVKVTHDAFEPSTRQLTIKVWNNYVRYVTVYVQYFDGQGKLLPPADTDSPNTEYSTHVTDIPDVPTLYGIPFVNTNYSEATLTFPPGASKARLLVGGLGHSPHDSSWRDLFPHGAYPDRAIPPECTHGTVMTSILDIGIVLFFLAIDIGTAAVSNYYRQASRSSAPSDFGKIIDALLYELDNIRVTFSALAIAAGIASGSATIMDLEDHRGKSTWTDLLRMAEVLAKVMVSIATSSNKLMKSWIEPLLYNMSKGSATKWIPVVGEMLAAMAVVGDVAQLLETSIEAGTSPWLVDNSIKVTYDATVTLKHDPDDAVFPRSAATWSLTHIINGVNTKKYITGDVTPVGTRSDPIIVPVTKIPIGGTVQYSVVFTNADGAQVGKGATAKLSNNDVNNLPREVELTITEIPIPITANTLFERQNTTAYSTADDGFTWTTNTDIGGTVQDSTDLKEINAITVGTVSGMAGYVWRTNFPEYWIRNLPTIQNEGQNTIQLQTGGPYSRKPLIVYDRLNPDLVNGDNFLLEPYEDTGYQVRRLELSADGGRLGWKTGESWGAFLNPLSALTLHPSGYLVGVNAETGKLDIHKIPDNPAADEDMPPLANSYAGPGTRPGLTQTPVGVAITVTGMIVVLEAGANQLQSFDTTGNAVPYFGDNPGPDNPNSYYAVLSSGANDTLLSLAVDGQGWFYVLSYTGNGSHVDDYAVDVYNQHGMHIVRSPGLNAATFDVDYWRNIFALNYEPVLNTDGTPHIDPVAGFVEPSASICIPTNSQ